MGKQNKIEKGKGALLTISIIALVLGLALIALGIIIIVAQCKNLANGINVGPILLIVLAAIMCLIGFAGVGFGVYFLIIGGALKATKGSLKEDNIAKVGTINMHKCSNCGTELEEGAVFCPNCGHNTTGVKTCPICGASNGEDNKKCTSCGADL